MDSNTSGQVPSSHSQKCSEEQLEGMLSNEGFLGTSEGSFCMDPTLLENYFHKTSESLPMAIPLHPRDSQVAEQGHLVFQDSLNGDAVAPWNVAQNVGSTSMEQELGIKSLPLPLLQFSPDPGFAQRAAMFSTFANMQGQSFIHRSSTVLNPLPNSQASGNVPLDQAKPAEDAMRKERIKAEPRARRDQPNSRKRKHNHAQNQENDENVSQVASEAKPDNKKTSKPVYSSDDYIHVRVRRGQATDSHSLAERARREKINQRMKLLQELVPNCHKVVGKAMILDEIINYVLSLQNQVEVLSRKLAAAGSNSCNMECSLFSKQLPADVSKEISSTYSINEQINSIPVQTVPSPPAAMSSVESAETLEVSNFQSQSPPCLDSGPEMSCHKELKHGSVLHHHVYHHHHHHHH